MIIKSRTDVITNSSDEVFILRTDKSIDEVRRYLESHTTGWDDPEILRKDEGCLMDAIDFGYLVDLEDPESLGRYRIDLLNETERLDRDTWDYIPIPESSQYHPAWLDFLWNNRDRINQRWAELHAGAKLPIPETTTRKTFSGVWGPYLPVSLVDEFANQYSGPLPPEWEVPESKNADTYVGMIGFQSIDENSIPYDDWDGILEEFNGINFHLG